MKLSVVIPAHNEEQNVEKIIKLLSKNFARNILEMIVVNDCSTDRTGKMLEELTKKYPKLKPVHRRSNGGVGNAIKRGLRKVSTKTDYVLMLDCDFHKNVSDIKKMIRGVEGYDGLLGSRYIEGSTLVGYPLKKKIANRVFHLLMRLFLRTSHIDVTNNFKFYKYEVVNKILPLLRGKGFSINAETGIYPILLGYKLKEIPVSWFGRTEEMGESSFKIIKAGPGYVRVLLDAIKFKYFSGRSYTLAWKRSEREHFDALIGDFGETYYGNLRPIAAIRFTRKAQLIFSLLNRIEKPRVLEIGCGTGILSKYLLRVSPQLNICGIDISPKAIGKAKKDLKRYSNAEFREGDICRLPYKDNSFDIVIGNSILHHVDAKKALKEAKRVLKSNGLVWFCEPNILNPQVALERVSIFRAFFRSSPDEKAFSRWQLKKDLQKSGFKDVKVEPYEFLHPLVPKSFLPIVVPALVFLERVPLANEIAGTLKIVARCAKRK